MSTRRRGDAGDVAILSFGVQRAGLNCSLKTILEFTAWLPEWNGLQTSTSLAAGV